MASSDDGDVELAQVNLQDIKLDLVTEGDPQVIETKIGKITIHIIRNYEALPTLITFPDAGLSCKSCFEDVLKANHNVFSKFRIIQVEAPGTNSKDPIVPYPTFTDLTTAVEAVVSHFKISKFFGFGVGVGGNVLLEYSIHHKDQVEGLILIGTSLKLQTWSTWSTSLWSAISNKVWGKNVMFKYNLQSLLSWDASPDLKMKLDECLSKANVQNVEALIDAYNKRVDIAPQLRSLPFRVLCFVGRQDLNYNEILYDSQPSFNPSNYSLVDLEDCGHLVNWEKPSRVGQPVTFMMLGLGYLEFRDVQF